MMDSTFKSPDLASGDMGEAVARMLEDPETLGKIMNIAGALGGTLPTLGSQKKSEPVNDEKHEKDDHYRSEVAASGENMSGRHERVKTCDRIRLLEAMRPFLSCEKRDKLDVVIKIIGLADAAGGLYGIKK